MLFFARIIRRRIQSSVYTLKRCRVLIAPPVVVFCCCGCCKTISLFIFHYNFNNSSVGEQHTPTARDYILYFSSLSACCVVARAMLLDYVVCVVVILTTSYSYVLTTTLTTLPLGNNSPQRQGDITHYFSPRRVAVLLPHEMLLD